MFSTLGDFFRTLGKPCRRHTMLVSRNLTEPLPIGQRWGHKAHLLICTTCREFASQLRFIRSAAMALGRTPRSPRPSSDQVIPPDTRRRMKEKMQNFRDHV